MDFIHEKILEYSEHFSEKENELLKRIKKITNIKTMSPRMLSGHLQGRLLSMISKFLRPKHILEIGTFTGYSALCMAEGLDKTGKLVTIDSNEETNLLAKGFFKVSDFDNQIELLEGDATKLIPKIKFNFDLVFIDADKKNYSHYFDLVIDKLNKGGVIIADNVLWSGKVLDEVKDPETQALHDFNIKVSKDPRVEHMLLPVRDGLMVLRKK